MNNSTLDHYGNWWAVLGFVIIFGILIVFVPFYKKSQRKPSSVYLAFVLAFALEMFGIPLSMFFVGWLFGIQLPEGILWGHTLQSYIGHWSLYIAIILMITGVLLLGTGWKRIYKKYWSHQPGKGMLVKDGIYKYIRHPQYTGFYLITLGMIVEWATIPLLLMWPIILILYYNLAKKEEKAMYTEFGKEYIRYKNKTKMFVPYIY